MSTPHTTQIEWRNCPEARVLEARVSGKMWRVRLNEFPEACLYSLIIDGKVVEDFNEWPEAWKPPRAQAVESPAALEDGEDVYLKADFQLEMGKLDTAQPLPPSSRRACPPTRRALS